MRIDVKYNSGEINATHFQRRKQYDTNITVLVVLPEFHLYCIHTGIKSGCYAHRINPLKNYTLQENEGIQHPRTS